jgi:hypothetical protein
MINGFERQDFRLRAAERRYAATFVYGGAKYPCCLGALMEGDPLTFGGFSPSMHRIIVVRKSALPLGTVFATGQPFQVIDSAGETTELKIKAMGLEDLVFAWQITGEAAAQGV